MGAATLLEGFHSYTRANEIAIAIDVVDATDGGPEFVVTEPFGGEAGLLAGVGAIPIVGGKHVSGVGRAFQEIVLCIELAGFDGLDFGVNRDEGVAETIEFFFGFAFGGFDHHRSRNRPGNRRSVEAEVHETFGDVFDGYAFVLAQVEDAFVGDETGFATVKDWEIILEALGNIVGVEYGIFGGVNETGTTHGCDVNPGDSENAGASPGSGRDGADGIFAAEINNGMAGEKFDEMFGDADRTHTGTAASVRDTESFVEVQMADICAHISRTAKADLGIQVRAVHIDLTAVGMNDFADFFDSLFEDAVG